MDYELLKSINEFKLRIKQSVLRINEKKIKSVFLVISIAINGLKNKQMSFLELLNTIRLKR